MEAKKVKSAFYNLLAKNLIISSVLFCLVFFDMQLQSSKMKGQKGPLEQIDLEAELSTIKALENKDYSVELISNKTVIEGRKVKAHEPFHFKISSQNQYFLRISHDLQPLGLIRLCTNKPEGSESCKIQTTIHLDQISVPDLVSSNTASAMILWDYDTNNFSYIEDNAYFASRHLYSDQLP